jgi:predicted RNA-binding protein with PUA-like domain
MKSGEKILIYHSGGVSAVVGVATVRSAARDDPKSPGSAVVDIEVLSRLAEPVSLANIKKSSSSTIGHWCARAASRRWRCPTNSLRGCTPEFPARNFETIGA